jgi:hypothetical protein
MLLVVIAGAAIGLGVWLVSARSKDPVTKAEIEHLVAQRPRGQVQFVLCNQEIVASRKPRPNPPQTWTCDTYLGRSKAHTQNGPSYQVIVSDERIKSIRRVPPH